MSLSTSRGSLKKINKPQQTNGEVITSDQPQAPQTLMEIDKPA